MFVESTQLMPDIRMGLYTPVEAAQFAKLKLQTFNRWFYGDKRCNAALQPRLETETNKRIITFWDLIQAVAVRRIRTSSKGRRVTLDHIRTVVQQCKEKGIDFPFARKHTLYWYSDRLILRTVDDNYIGLAPGIDRDQLYHGTIIEPYLEDVSYGGDQMAQDWTPLENAKYQVVFNPELRFGMPTIQPKGVLVSALLEAVQSEGSVSEAAEAFEIEPDAVTLALKYSEYLTSAA